MNILEQDPAWPLLVRIEGQKQAAALMNSKAYQKSIETNYPWILHPETKRILPWPGEPGIITLRRSCGFYELSLPEDADIRPYGNSKPQDISFNGVESGNPVSLASDIKKTPNPERKGSLITRGVRQSNSLSWLTELIAERRRNMPEGSYTTHLFSKGPEKIRKKIGEEVVEVLLARDSAQMVSEISDLVYHLCVLLEASGLSWHQVEKELERRHK
ncbi:Phosphoribosyl-AMP cyclohydrolase / Phosphoribosyl-ATP pyrophosphatase [Olavius algarvensis spirochete endosymbiont]|uniref:phosphoribosyl-ATP diphosphatase n=1 Tax=Olavius algarvensis spirochete endosymbiont TaxID=260710 RepID=UPI000F23F3D7|nr:phosphoribosyl-ATP diphosphatase [Olavius algarvensis spirochete endosymbiont]VDA99678.1 Phosphoribosyl-AMP cyclohydrolase / Phosphoribosyl-ATP pyrophosphatase [Olavius algarvensis spirochete endosymbiont]